MTNPWARALTRARNGRAWWALWFAFSRHGLATFEALYAYFRWADDVVDAPDRREADVRAFVARQVRIVAGQEPAESPGEQAIVAVLAGNDGDRLRPVVEGMLAALHFDAHRGPRPISPVELERQVERVGDAFVTALWVCAGEPGPLPGGLAELARAACFVHVLRDREIDRTLGYENRPPGPSGAPMADAAWVPALAAEAEARFHKGEAALSAAMGWRTRWLLRGYAGRYRRALPAATRGDAGAG